MMFGIPDLGPLGEERGKGELGDGSGKLSQGDGLRGGRHLLYYSRVVVLSDNWTLRTKSS